jgi:hypothetical protein
MVGSMLSPTFLEAYARPITEEVYLCLPQFINLRPLVRLRILGALINIRFDNEESKSAAEDLSKLLAGVNSRNSLAYIMLRFSVIGTSPFPEVQNQKWGLLFDQILRVAGDEPFELDICFGIMHPETHPDQEHVEGLGDVYTFLQEQMVPLRDLPTVRVTFEMAPHPHSPTSDSLVVVM